MQSEFTICTKAIPITFRRRSTRHSLTLPLETLRAAIDNMVASNDTIFREILSNIPEKQKELLYAIAKDGEAERITSAAFIKRHSLTSASSVQSAMKKLLEKDIITEINKVFSVTDKLFAMWMNRLYGNNDYLS